MATDLAALDAIRHGQIDDSRVPGTVKLVDVDHNMSAKHSKAHQDIVLVPTPSDDPDDPLNWTPRRKLLSLACMCIYVWFTGMATSVVYSVEPQLSDALDTSVDVINAGTGYMFLLAGWSLLFWMPFALQYGKRSVYLVSTLGIIAVTVWGPYARGSGQWYAKNVLSGFFVSPIEALPELTVADVFFTHERGTYMGVYAFVLAGSNFFAPIISGFINEEQNYKWVFYYQAFFCSAAFLFLFFFMEETNYDRALTGRKPSTASTVATMVDEKSPATPDAASDDIPMSTASRKTFWAKLSLRDKPRPQRMVYHFMLSLRLLTWPVIFYAGFSYGSYLIWFNVLNATASLILGASPYNFNSGIVGLSYLACFFGVIAGALYTGRVNDWMSLKLARRNGGVFEPEHRLWGFLICLFVLPASLILWGVGAANGVNWFGLIVAMLGTAFCNTTGVTLSVNYLIDSYPDIGGDGLTTVIIIRNTMSFAIGYGITPWLDGLGTQNCFISAAFVGLAASSVFLLMIWKGKALREKHRMAYWNLVRKHADMGMLH